MRISRFVPLLAGFCVMSLTACGATTGGTSPTPTANGATSTPTSVATPTPTPTPAPATATPTASQTAVATSIDPCQLVTSSEASALAGTTFGTGMEGTNEGGGKTCIYGYQTTNVFMVEVAVASDAATAQADWAQEEAQVQGDLQKATQGLPSGVTINFNINDTSNISGADMAAVGTFSTTISGVTLGGTAVYVLKGATFFTFSDLVVGSPPSTSAMEAQAETSLGQLP